VTVGGSPHTPSYGEVDLTTCDREPIHIPGAIQPHGALIALDADHRVRMVSANCADLLGVPADEALGRPIVPDDDTTLLAVRLAR
jgi:light-regulated signal transduction histidine kinase (bacteriophytochrome)